MKMIITALALALTTSVAFAQSSRETALEQISAAMEELDRVMPDQHMALSQDAYEDRIAQVSEIVQQLKHRLASNDYIRVGGFSLGVPWGVSISFEFVQ